MGRGRWGVLRVPSTLGMDNGWEWILKSMEDGMDKWRMVALEEVVSFTTR